MGAFRHRGKPPIGRQTICGFRPAKEKAAKAPPAIKGAESGLNLLTFVKTWRGGVARGSGPGLVGSPRGAQNNHPAKRRKKPGADFESDVLIRPADVLYWRAASAYGGCSGRGARRRDAPRAR